jgi:hypothetical protein
MLPSLLPLRIHRNIVSTVLALCIPIMVFTVIGRTVEIEKAQAEAGLAKRALDLGGGAGAGISESPPLCAS